MVISPAMEYAFVSTVKGGTNSLYQVLINHYAGQRHGEFHETDVRDIPEQWFLFSTCRNPYTRAVSIWYSTCMRGKDRYQFRQMCPNPDVFEVFAEWAALMQTQLPRLTVSQQQLLMPQSARHGEIPFDRILRIENLDQEFAALPFVRSTAANLPQLNPTRGQRNPAEHYLSDRAILAVQRWMEADFVRYGYSREMTPVTPLERVA